MSLRAQVVYIFPPTVVLSWSQNGYVVHPAFLSLYTKSVHRQERQHPFIVLLSLEMCNYVLDCSGCCNKVPLTGWLRNSKHLFLTGLEAGKSRILAPADSMFGEGSLVHRWLSFCCFLMWLKRKGSPWLLSHEHSALVA